MSKLDFPRDQCQLAQRRCHEACSVYRLGISHQYGNDSRDGALSGLLMGKSHRIGDVPSSGSDLSGLLMGKGHRNGDVPSSCSDLSNDPLGTYSPYEVSRSQAQDHDAVC